MQKKSLAVIVLCGLLLGGALLAGRLVIAKDSGETAPTTAIACPVTGKAINKAAFAAHKDGQVYFCCEKCVAAFAAEPAKFAAKANQQLVATGQYMQVKCPLAGAKLNPQASHEVAGQQVQFCCQGCQAKVAKAAADQQQEMVFGDKPFAKGFVAAPAK